MPDKSNFLKGLFQLAGKGAVRQLDSPGSKSLMKRSHHIYSQETESRVYACCSAPSLHSRQTRIPSQGMASPTVKTGLLTSGCVEEKPPQAHFSRGPRFCQGDNTKDHTYHLAITGVLKWIHVWIGVTPLT